MSEGWRRRVHKRGTASQWGRDLTSPLTHKDKRDGVHEHDHVLHPIHERKWRPMSASFGGEALWEADELDMEVRESRRRQVSHSQHSSSSVVQSAQTCCTCKEYRMRDVMDQWQGKQLPLWAQEQLVSRTSVHGVLLVEVLSCEGQVPQPGQLVVFAFGSVVGWGIPQELFRRLVDSLRQYETEPYAEIETDELMFVRGDTSDVGDGYLIVDSGPDFSQHLVVMSYAIAQSVKLGHFERTAELTIEGLQPYVERLNQSGRSTSSSQQSLRQEIGNLYLIESQVKSSAVADTPVFLWDLEDLEIVHQKVRDYLDVDSRLAAVSDRLDSLADFFETLRREDQSTHEFHMTWIIIYLLIFDVIVELFQHSTEIAEKLRNTT